MIYSNSPIFSKFNKPALLILLIFLAYLAPADDFSCAQNSNPKFSIDYKNDFLTLSARDADLKNVLFSLAAKTDIKVWYPDSLKEKITIKFSKNSLRRSLEKLLKGLNHVIIYSGPNNAQAAVSEVYIFGKSKKSGRSSVRKRQNANRIRVYERRIESLKKQLSKIDVNSRRGINYQRQIQRFENLIERLQR